MKQFVATTKNGFDVYVDTEHSHAATHLKETPKLLDLVKEILAEYEVEKEMIRFETNMGRIVGPTDLVETREGDEIFYAKRPNREEYTRFVRNKKRPQTRFVTIHLDKKDSDECHLFTAWIGRLTPPFPTGKEDTEESKEFWSNHALVAETQTIVPGTETKECPW